MTDTALLAPAWRPQKIDPLSSIRRLAVTGGLAITAFAVILGGWSVTTQIAGAVMAGGRVIVESSVKKVQHPTGGVVGQLLVREGQHVKADDLLMRLDQTQTLAALDIIREGLDEMTARRARDEAERDGAETVAFSDELRRRVDEPRIAHLIAEEEDLFQARLANRNSEKAQYNEQIEQLSEQAKGIEAEIEGKTQEIYWNGEEMRRVRELWSRKLVEFMRLTTLQRDEARL